MSGRPPPPLPPKASAPTRTKSTALKRLTRSSVTPTTIEALPSARATTATTPEPTLFFMSSARLLSSFAGMSSSTRPMNLTPPRSFAA